MTSRRARTYAVGAVAVVAVTGGLVLLAVRGPGDDVERQEVASARPGATPASTVPTPADSSAPTDPPSAEPTPTATAAPADGTEGATAGTAGDVAVQVTTAEWDTATGAARVNGFVEVVDADGTCTATFQQGAESHSVSRAATPDAATTSCGELTMDRSVLRTGTWLVVLSFESAHNRGVSPPTQIEVS